MEGVIERLGMKLGEKRKKGIATLSAFEFNQQKDPMYNIRMIINSGAVFRVFDGEYVRLVVNGDLVMSDTTMERRSNKEFVNKANGRVFIAGLGIGLILHNLREKVKSGEVVEIVVMEKYKDVIDLVSPHYIDLPITYIEADALEYKPGKEEIYDTIYFDIWPHVTDDNLDEIKMLHNRWKNRKRKGNPNAWMNSWMKEFLQRERARERKY